MAEPSLLKSNIKAFPSIILLAPLFLCPLDLERALPLVYHSSIQQTETQSAFKEINRWCRRRTALKYDQCNTHKGGTRNKPECSAAPSDPGNTFNKARGQAAVARQGFSAKGGKTQALSFLQLSAKLVSQALQGYYSKPWNSTISDSITVNQACWHGQEAGPDVDSSPSALPDLLPGFGG